MPTENNVNKSYKEYKKSVKKESEEIFFAIVKRDKNDLLEIAKDGKQHIRAKETGLTLDKVSISHKISEQKKIYHELTINKGNDNPIITDNLSIIAYYKNADPGADKDKEMILGQLNIIPTSIETYKQNVDNNIANAQSKYYSDYLSNCGIELQSDPKKIVIDINFVHIATDINDGVPDHFEETSEIINRMNAIYKQVGIEFRRRGNPRDKGYESILITDAEMCDPNTKTPYIKKTYTFKTEEEEKRVERSVPNPIGSGTMSQTDVYKTSYSDEDWKTNFGGKATISYYENVTDDIDIVNLFREKYSEQLFNKVSIKENKIYTQLLAEHFTSKKEQDASPEKVKELHKLFAGYFENRLITIFIFDKIDIGRAEFKEVELFKKKPEFFMGGESGFATIKGNMVVLYAGAMADIDYILAHELGHCLGLEHSFNTNEDIYYATDLGYKFTPSKTYNGVSYNNIMDYQNRNPKFTGNTFATFQQKKMLDYLSSEFLYNVYRGQNNIVNFSKLLQYKDTTERQKYALQLEKLYKDVFKS